MVEGQARQYLDNFKNQLAQQGVAFDQYMKVTNGSEAQLLADAKEPALRQVRLDLALAAIIKEENLEASDEDVDAEYQKLAEQYGLELDMVKKYVQADQVKDQVITRKAVAVVVDSAETLKPEKKKKAAKKAEDEPAGEEKAKKAPKKAKKAEDGEEKPKKAAKKTKKAEDEPEQAEE